MPLALFGITNDSVNLAVNLLVLFLVVIWIALVVWTYLDARRRLDDSVLVGAATVASLFPFVGTIVYSILRPPEFLEDAHERELEIRASELRVRQLEEQSCPSCGFPIERTYLRCPNCRSRVKDPCESCGKPIDPRWALCPYCETPARRAAPAPPSGRRIAREQRRAEPRTRAPQAQEPRAKTARSAAGPPPRRRKPAAPGERKQAGAEREPAATRPSSSQRAARAAQRAAEGQPGPAEAEGGPPRPAPTDGGGEERPRPATT
jgi:hypothetical protein